MCKAEVQIKREKDTNGEREERGCDKVTRGR